MHARRLEERAPLLELPAALLGGDGLHAEDDVRAVARHRGGSVRRVRAGQDHDLVVHQLLHGQQGRGAGLHEPDGGGAASLITLNVKTACDISSLSFYPHEAEALLLPGTRLRVLSRKRNGNVAEIEVEEVVE